ncbi:hypothetical protein Pfo_017351 [Paulownia fortunei]|nr:hypothetical protein Pfo_017351 [Paulownia fortunei]
MLTSWLNRCRRRYLCLILCSLFLLPLFCAMEICFPICLRQRKQAADCGDGRHRCEEGGDEVGLLQRYLEDQLLLVVGSMYDCGDDDVNVGEEDGVNVEYFNSTRPFLQ